MVDCTYDEHHILHPATPTFIRHCSNFNDDISFPCEGIPTVEEKLHFSHNNEVIVATNLSRQQEGQPSVTTNYSRESTLD